MSSDGLSGAKALLALILGIIFAYAAIGLVIGALEQ